MKRQCHAPEVHILGEAVAAFGTLEFFVEMALWQLLGEKSSANLSAQALTPHMPFRAMTNALEGIFELKYPGLATKDLKALVRVLSTAEQERNALVHSSWNYQGGPGSLVRLKIVPKDKGRTRMFHHMTTERMEGIRDQILGAQDAVARFMIKYLQDGDDQSPAG